MQTAGSFLPFLSRKNRFDTTLFTHSLAELCPFRNRLKIVPSSPMSFFHAIHSLRTQGDLVFSLKALHTTPAEDGMVVDFLKAEYAQESLQYPHELPGFDAQAALWAARVLYFSAQLFVYRENTEKDLSKLFVPYDSPGAAAFLSTDLCLRFLPSLVTGLTAQDAADPLIPKLREMLPKFPYSTIGEDEDFAPAFSENGWSDSCYRQLYTERVIARRDAHQLQWPPVRDAVLEMLGDHAESYWPGLKTLSPEQSFSAL